MTTFLVVLLIVTAYLGYGYQAAPAFRFVNRNGDEYTVGDVLDDIKHEPLAAFKLRVACAFGWPLFKAGAFLTPKESDEP